jgi:predicted nucleic acid-binding protein
LKIIISDTGPILSLAFVGRLDLLFDIYADFYLPEAVFAELERYLPKYTAGSEAILKKIFPHVIPIGHREWLVSYTESLGPGEKECLVLVKETGINYLLTDDALARRFAESLGIVCIGSLAIFIKAKEIGLIKAIRPIFQLLANSDRFFQNELMNSILIKLGEDIL